MKKSDRNIPLWLVVGVAVLIVLLIIWLTVADLSGDTDVAAAVVAPVSDLNDVLP